MLDTTKAIAERVRNTPVIAFFSTGKDSIVMCDLLYTSGISFVPVFMYFVDGLYIKERILTAYERRWNRHIERVPHFTAMNLKAGTKKYKMASVETGLKKRFDTAWVALGYKRNDSMARRGMLAHLDNGIDERNRKLYPVADWSNKQIMAYIKFHKLPLPVEYAHGLKNDFCVLDAALLLYLKNNFREDYEKVIKEFPQIEAMVWAQIN